MTAKTEPVELHPWDCSTWRPVDARSAPRPVKCQFERPGCLGQATWCNVVKGTLVGVGTRWGPAFYYACEPCKESSCAR